MMDKKFCSYCQSYHDAADFVTLERGRGGRSRILMCGPCHRSRQNSKASKERLKDIVAENKARNRRQFNTNYR